MAKRYEAYLFMKKDPVIDEVRTLLQDHFGTGPTTGSRKFQKALRDVEKAGGPSVACMDGWFRGATRRPQSATLEAAGRAMGYKRVWVRDRGDK